MKQPALARMAGMRDLLIHAYDRVDLEEVWQAYQQFPAIRESVTRILSSVTTDQSRLTSEIPSILHTRSSIKEMRLAEAFHSERNQAFRNERSPVERDYPEESMLR